MRLSFLLILGLNSLIFCQTDKDLLREEAKQFSLDFVKLYFQNDCEKNNQLISDSLIKFNSKSLQIFAKKEYKDKLCKSHSKAVHDKSKSFSDYLKSYNIKIFSVDEIENELSKSLPDEYIATDTDYFFLGGQLKESSEESFVWDDAFSFMIRKENGHWVVKSL